MWCVRAQGALGDVLLDPKQVPRNFGSGFLWDAQGHVVTNYHVSVQRSPICPATRGPFSDR